MLDIRMKELQQRYTKDLSEALEKLERNYNSTRTEAFEKLVHTYMYFQMLGCQFYLLTDSLAGKKV